MLKVSLLAIAFVKFANNQIQIQIEDHIYIHHDLISKINRIKICLKLFNNCILY